MRTRASLALVLLAALLPVAVRAGSRGEPTICAGLPDARGICNAYCERLDCPHKAPPSCARLRERFVKKTGSPVFPCDTTCSVSEHGVLLTTGPATKLDLGFTGLDHGMPFIDDAELTLGLCCDGDTCGILGAPPVGASFLAPVPVSAAGVPFCIVNTIRDRVTGTYDCGTGCAAANVPLTASVFLRSELAKPCPVCVGDASANDGVKGGTCDGGATPGGACDANGTSPLFGATSLDCLPEGVDVGDVSVDLAPLTTGTASLTAKINCAAFGAPSGACHCPGEVFPNPCLDFTCSPSGVCENGPMDGICSGQPFRFCVSNEDCEDTFPGAGTCTTINRSCFPSTISATGECDPEGGKLVSVFCFPATRAPAVNVVAGLPGPARITLPVSTDGCQ
jgi:hypothetical protein